MKKIALIIGFLILIFVAYTFITTGFFRTIENKSDWKVEKEIPLPGAEDITVSLSDSFALISSTKRMSMPPEEEEFGGLYFMDLKSGKFTTRLLTPYLTKSFAPHGISMLKTNTGYKVMAINHGTTGHSIEVFNFDKDSLFFEKTITDTSIVSPNDVVMIDENRFYFTNDHGYTKGIGKIAEEYLGLSLANVIYFDGRNFIEVAKGIGYANGINFDAKRNLIFVASPRKFLIKVYSKKEDGALEFIEDIPCGTGVDNIEFDKDGNLWVGGHPNLLRFAAYAKGRKETSPSEIIKISYKGKGDYTVESVYTNDGTAMSALTVAATFGDIILAGNVMDKKFLVLKKGE
jgi:arylesterase / paraoxonase